MSDLAARLVNEWAADRYTQPTPAEQDLARWIVERVEEDPDLHMAHAALQSWSKRRAAIETALGKTPHEVQS